MIIKSFRKLLWQLDGGSGTHPKEAGKSKAPIFPHAALGMVISGSR